VEGTAVNVDEEIAATKKAALDALDRAIDTDGPESEQWAQNWRDNRAHLKELRQQKGQQ